MQYKPTYHSLNANFHNSLSTNLLNSLKISESDFHSLNSSSNPTYVHTPLLVLSNHINYFSKFCGLIKYYIHRNKQSVLFVPFHT